jgi:uncharacterized protein YcbK (DUF882 family)
VGDLSAHFSKSEFRDHRSGAIVDIDTRLIECLERLRALKGNKPITIVSGYRSPATNRAVGGARNSQHLYGRAADIHPGYCTVDEALHCGFSGVGYSSHGQVVHVDVRPGSVVTFRDGP